MKMLEASIKRAVRLMAIGAYQHYLANLEDRRSPEFAGRWAIRGSARTAGMLLSECCGNPFSVVARDTKT